MSSSVVTSAAWEAVGKSGGELVSTIVTGKIYSVPAIVEGAEVSPAVTAGDSGAMVSGGRVLVASRTVVSGAGWRSEVA